MIREIADMENSMVYWVGLILLSLASVVLFSVAWLAFIVIHHSSRMEFLKGAVPLIVGAIIFIFIGLSMMNHKKSNRANSE